MNEFEERAEIRTRFTVLATLFAFVILIPVAVGSIAYYKQNQDRIEDNEAAVRRERNLRVAFNRDLNEFVFQQCLAAEKRDAIIVKILAVIANPPPVVREAIDALEPANERDCVPPPAEGLP